MAKQIEIGIAIESVRDPIAIAIRRPDNVLFWNAFGRKERWAWWAIAAGTAAWFTVDSARCVQHGAWFNILLINLPVLMVVGLPLGMTFRWFAVENRG